MKKGLVITAACAMCVVCFAAGVFAADLIENVSAEIRRDFTIVVDGEEQTFNNAQGETVYPLLYDGTTYLPVRAIGNLMGKTVYWYENEKKIELKNDTTTVTDADVIVNGGSSGSSSSGTSLTPQEGEISLDEAKKIALDRAGLSESDVTFTKERLGRDDGIREYDIEFYTDTNEYSAEINASNGNIISWDVDTFRVGGNGNGQAGGSSGGGGSVANGIGIDRAKEIALEKAGLNESDVTFTEARSEFDDGRHVYEIEFRQGRTEYSAEILASDGSVISFDIDND